MFLLWYVAIGPDCVCIHRGVGGGGCSVTYMQISTNLQIAILAKAVPIRSYVARGRK